MQICIIYIILKRFYRPKPRKYSFGDILCTWDFRLAVLFAGGQGVSGPESSALCGFPCSSASVALHWCSSHWNRVLSDGARKGKFYCITSYSHPSSTCLCADILSVGSIYLNLSYGQGRIFQDPRLPGVSAAERAALYVAAVEVLARLHSLDLVSLDLKGYGKGSGYCKRQVGEDVALCKWRCS